MQRERRVRFHWQNLTKDEGRGHLPISGRAWLYVFAWTFHVEWHLWSRKCAIGVDLGRYRDGDAVLFHFALPPVNFYFGISPPWESAIRRMLPEKSRTCEAYFNEWALWVFLWSKPHEWSRSDPWWVRGLTFHIDDFFLGEKRYSKETLATDRVTIELDGHKYNGTAEFERCTWKRPRWFARVREYTSIRMDRGHGLPHSGKGESGYDCGDDALYGWSTEGLSVKAAIDDGIRRVMKARSKYGNPSEYGPKAVAA